MNGCFCRRSFGSLNFLSRCCVSSHGECHVHLVMNFIFNFFFLIIFKWISASTTCLNPGTLLFTLEPSLILRLWRRRFMLTWRICTLTWSSGAVEPHTVTTVCGFNAAKQGFVGSVLRSDRIGFLLHSSFDIYSQTSLWTRDRLSSTLCNVIFFKLSHKISNK